MGLGNPGSRYDDTRHNVGWWAVDHLAHAWNAGPFREVGPALHCGANVEGEAVTLVKPLTFMNRSAGALHPFLGVEGFDVETDLLVIVDDATRDVGRLRLRPDGSSGGHNGLRSIEGLVGRSFARLRIGVGVPPEGDDLVRWVLSPMASEDEDAVLAVLRELPELMESWITHGVRETMNRYNR